MSAPVGRVLPPRVGRGHSVRIVERNVLAYRRMWFIFLSGFFEPLLYLLSIGIGVGRLVGRLPGPGGQSLSYQSFVAPGLLAAAAMNGSILDTTMNFFVRFKYAHTYDAMLATPLTVTDIAGGEVVWALIRGAIYSFAFLGAMVALGLVSSPWALLALPGAVLIGYAFAGAGLAATTWMRSWIDFDFVNLALMPSFLFSATFFPLSRYPEALALVVRLTPLYQGVAFERAACSGALDLSMLGHAVYLVALGWGGLHVASRRLLRLLQP